MKGQTITLYRPTGPNDSALVKISGYKQWPPRLARHHVDRIPLVMNNMPGKSVNSGTVKQSGVGDVTRFLVKKSFMDKKPIQLVGASHHTDWIPAEDLRTLNDNIIGLIEFIGEYR